MSKTFEKFWTQAERSVFHSIFFVSGSQWFKAVSNTLLTSSAIQSQETNRKNVPCWKTEEDFQMESESEAEDDDVEQIID